MPTMVREAWTDERLDDLKERMDSGFLEVKSEIAEVKAELKSTRAELKAEIGSTRAELKAEIAKLEAKFDRLTYTLIAALIGLLATHYLG
jgi:Skp family chaperone for outer membrane proteins